MLKKYLNNLLIVPVIIIIKAYQFLLTAFPIFLVAVNPTAIIPFKLKSSRNCTLIYFPLIQMLLFCIWTNVDLFLMVCNIRAIWPHLSAKLSSSFSSATVYDLPSSFCCHTRTKSMASFSHYSAWLICSFHHNILSKKWSLLRIDGV